MDVLRQKAQQIFEYLLAVKNLSMPVERDMGKYDPLWWTDDLPSIDGCFTQGTGLNNDAWLEIHKQKLISPPNLPQILLNWVEGKWTNPDSTPTFKNKIVKDNGEEEGFEDSEERVHNWVKWIKNWNEWADITLPKTKIQNIYGQFFTLIQKFQREDEAIELAWGHGLLAWNYKGQKIYRPLFVTRLELLFDAEKGVFEVVPTDKGTVLETDMLNNLEIPNMDRITAIERHVNEEDINPWDEQVMEPLLNEIIHTISSDGRVENKSINYNKIKPYDVPVIYNTSMFFVRNRASRQWQIEIKSIIEAINEEFQIPESIRSIVSTGEELESLKDTLGAEQNDDWNRIGEEILFPLEANNEQKEIVQRLASNYGVVVQGPPGTGKSHTIANLICHLLAHGRRVLVTSHTERALKVLADKIPKEIKHLCVNVTGGDTKSLKEIEASIGKLQENLSYMDVNQLKKEIDSDKEELNEVRDKLANLRYKLKNAAIRENNKIIFEGKEFLPLDISKWVKQNEHFNWIPDSINFDSEPPEEEKMLRLFTIAGTLYKQDLEALSLKRPELEKLPPPAQFKKVLSSWAEEEKRTIQCSRHIEGWQNINESLIDIDLLIDDVNRVIEELKQFDQPWLQKILEDITKGGIQRENWESLVNDCRNVIGRLLQLNRELAQYSIEIPQDKPLSILKDDISVLNSHLSSNKKINWFFISITGRKFKYLLDGCKINGSPIRSLEDTKILLQFLDKLLNTESIVNKWNSFIGDVEGELLKVTQPRLIACLDQYLTLLETGLKWEESTKQLKTVVDKFSIKALPNWTDKNYLEKLKLGFEAIKQQRNFLQATLNIEELKKTIEHEASNLKAHPIWNNLLEAIENHDSNLWEVNINELHRLSTLEPLRDELLTLSQMLKSIALRWIERILNEGGIGKALELPRDWKQAWKWSRLNTFITKLHAEDNPEEIQNEINKETIREKRILEKIIANSTWMEQISRTTDDQKRSLTAWIQSIRRIGKGTGKYAAKHRKDAKKEMEVCRGAIPVWIMPIHRVIENLSITKDLFDVVIVDESSQSDIFALSVLFRAKKVVIVGDDKQISPESVGTDQSVINDLILRYLNGIPQNHKFDMQTSLYDTALRIFPGSIMLKEHFRCVPEIIQFSNDLCYGGSIEPLRFPKNHELLSQPIRTIRVEEGRREENTIALNEPEAKAVVKAILECCNDEKYNNKTMGVISLQGFYQAKLIEELLREELGEHEMLKRKLICGDAYSFQGDERNIMFLSMVTANNVNFRALTSSADEKRFNVAASRAKDQLWLFHSVDLDDLNPNCLRAKLLRHCLNPHRVAVEEAKVKHLFDSDFERDVFRLISARGYSVRPQVQIGRYRKRIDLVVEGLRSRLAIECDGDKWHGPDQWEADQERQMLLERVGWVFWRVRGSTFYYNPDKAMKTLWDKLDEMGIEPEKTKIQKQILMNS